MSAPASSGSEVALVRALGVRQLTASIINVTVGAGIFALPALVAAGLGAAAPVAFLACGLAMTCIVASFAAAGSRVSLTGGLYAYVEVAFGGYIGYLAGVLLWLTAILSVSSVAAALTASVGEFLPALNTGPGRVGLLVAVFGGLAVINVRGVRMGARTVETLTVAKLLPLLILVGVGVFSIDVANIAWPGWPDGDALGRTVLLLIFAFVGIEVALVPSGEVKNPAYTVPRAIFLALGITTGLYMAIQLVAQGVLGPSMSQYEAAPLAEAASRFLGNTGRTLMLLGATVSMFGYVSGDMLGSPRTLFAFGRDGVLPKVFARIHPEYRTPSVAIIAHAIVACTVAASSTFQHLAILSNIALLTLYLLCCVASWELGRRDVRTDAAPFTFPGERVVPIIAVAVIVWILSNATRDEFAVTGAVMALATVLYLLRRLRAPNRSTAAS
ncbi:MAG: APC family permease [Acidobacteriota bacterium]